MAQRGGGESLSPWRAKIQLDRCLTNLIQLWAGGWSEDPQRSLPTYIILRFCYLPAQKEITRAVAYSGLPQWCWFFTEMWKNLITSVPLCLSKLVDIMNGYNKGEAKSVGLAFSGKQTKNPVLTHMSCTQQSCALCAAEEYVAFHLQRGNSARML